MVKLTAISAAVVAATAALVSAQQTPAAETATAKCTNPLLRKEIRQLDDKEFATLISAFRKMKEATGPNSLDYLSHMHMDNAMAVHGNPTFLVWHRRYLRAFEEGLRAHEPTVTVPYWDWGVDAQAPEQSILFTEGYLGGNGRAGDHCVTNGPFAGWTMNVPNQHCLPRQFNNGDHITPFWPSEALIRMQQTSNTYDELRRSIENGCHGAVHLGISGDMSTMQAPNDLYFFLHHCMIDKIYTEWQSVNPGVRNFMYDGTDPTGRKVMIDDPLPAFNEHVKDVLDVRSPVNCYEYAPSRKQLEVQSAMSKLPADFQNKWLNGGQQTATAPAPAAPATDSAKPAAAADSAKAAPAKDTPAKDTPPAKVSDNERAMIFKRSDDPLGGLLGPLSPLLHTATEGISPVLGAVTGGNARSGSSPLGALLGGLDIGNIGQSVARLVSMATDPATGQLNTGDDLGNTVAHVLRLTKLAAPPPLPDAWAKMNNLDPAEVRRSHDELLSFLGDLNRDEKYVSPVALVNMLGDVTAGFASAAINCLTTVLGGKPN